MTYGCAGYGSGHNPSLWLVFRTRHGSQIWCMFAKITKTRWEPGKKNPIAPLPRSSSLLTLPQGSLATPYHVVAGCATPGIKSKSFFSNLKFWKFSDFDNFEIPKNFEEKNHHRKIWQLRDFFWPNIFKNISFGSSLPLSKGWPRPAG